MRTLRWKEARVRTGGVEDAIVVERAESALVVRSADTDAAAVGFAAALPAAPERTTVVVDASAVGVAVALPAEPERTTVVNNTTTAKTQHTHNDGLLGRLRDLLYAESP